MSSSRTTWSNPAPLSPTRKPERIVQNQKSFCTIYKRKGSGQYDEIEQEPKHTLDAAFKSLDCDGPPQSRTPRPQNNWLWAPQTWRKSPIHILVNSSFAWSRKK